jgi:hypothetical protein
LVLYAAVVGCAACFGVPRSGARLGGVPPAERIATFDNDGTLWSEQAICFQLAFALDRVKALTTQHPEWKTTQPFKAVVGGDTKAPAASGTAFGNSDGDQQMLQWTAAGTGARSMGLVHHTDSARDWRYDRQSHIGKLDKALDEATATSWIVVDMQRDWKVVYRPQRPIVPAEHRRYTRRSRTLTSLRIVGARGTPSDDRYQRWRAHCPRARSGT